MNIGPDPVTGRRRQVSRTVRMAERKRIPDEVKDIEARLRSEVGRGQHATAKATMGELLDKWLAKVRPKHSPNTMHAYDRCVRLYLRPALGDVRVDKLHPQRLEAVYAALERGGGRGGRPLAPTTVRHCHAIVRAALSQAVRWGWVERNVATLADPPSEVRAVTSVPSREDVEALIARASTDEMRLLIRLATATGARRGEMCGLRWSDIDLEVGGAVIRRAVWQVKDELGVKVPKTGKPRVIPLGPAIVRDLQAHHERQSARAERAGAPLTDGYVLSESLDASEPLAPNVLTSRFRNLAARCELPIRLHDLRHAAVSWALAAGAHPRDVAAFAGHASTRMTLDVYGHAMPAGLRAVAAALDSADFTTGG